MAREDLQGQTGGGGIVDFDFEVTDAWFGLSEAFEAAVVESGEQAPNQIFLHWVGKTDLEDWPVLTEDGFHPSWKVGPDWEIRDGGKSIEYVGSGKARFRKSMGRLCDQVFEITESVANTDQDPFKEAHPKDATAWIGTKWFMGEKHYDFNGGFKADDLMPLEYRGKGAVSAPAAAPAAAASNGLREQVENLARSIPDYQTFQSAALQLPGVAADGALVAEIADKAKLYDKVNS